MAVGIPVIASNVGGIPSLIENGKDGLLCEPGSISDLAKKIEDLFNNRNYAAILSKNSIKRALNNNFPSIVALQTISVYNEIIKKHVEHQDANY
jgi:glycosyltransferase involved in cell wall biosynthesis